MFTRINEVKGIGSLGILRPGKGDEYGFCKQTVILANNAVGKTTLSTILKSCGNGDSVLLAARTKLRAGSEPFVSLDLDSGSVRYQDGRWHQPSGEKPFIAVFDQAYINENIFSTEVTSDHLKSIHLTILGAEGSAINKELEKD